MISFWNQPSLSWQPKSTDFMKLECGYKSIIFTDIKLKLDVVVAEPVMHSTSHNIP